MRLANKVRSWLAKKLDPAGFVASHRWVSQGGEVPTPCDIKIQAEAYTKEDWVYVCVSTIALSCARVMGQVQKKEGKEWRGVEDHPLDLLLANPNPKLKLTQHSLWEHTFSSLELTGQCYWFILKNVRGIPIGIIPLFSHRVKIIPSERDFILGYIYRVDEEDLALKPDEIIQFKRWHPLDDYYGFSAIEAATLPITTDLYAQSYNRRFYQNDATPGGLLTSEQRLSKESADEARARWEESYKGVQQAHKIAVLGHGLKYEKISLSPADAKFLELRDFNRDEILSVFRVPPSMTGVYNRFRATSDEEEKIFNKHTVAPKLASVEQFISVQLLPMFLSGEQLRYKFENPLAKDEEMELKRDDLDLKYGILTPDEVRARRYGLGPHPKEQGATPYPLMIRKISPDGDRELEKIRKNENGELEELEKILSGTREGVRWETLRGVVDVLFKEWNVVGDDRTCNKCFLNASIHPIPFLALFPSGHWGPPAHDGCRCWLEFYIRISGQLYSIEKGFKIIGGNGKGVIESVEN